MNQVTCVEGAMIDFHTMWEETSYQLERLQCDPDCALQEHQMLQTVAKTPYCIPFEWGHMSEKNVCGNGVHKSPTGKFFYVIF